MKAAVLSAIVGVASAQNVVYRPRVVTTAAAPVRVAGAPIRYGAMPTTTVAAAPTIRYGAMPTTTVAAAPRVIAASQPLTHMPEAEFAYEIAAQSAEQSRSYKTVASIDLYNNVGINVGVLGDINPILNYDAYAYAAEIAQNEYDALIMGDNQDWEAITAAKSMVDASESLAEAHQYNALNSPLLAGLVPQGIADLAPLMFPYKFRDFFGILRDGAAADLDLLVKQAAKNRASVADWELAAAYDNYDATNNMHDFWTFNTLNAFGVLPAGQLAGIPNIYAMPALEAATTWVDLAEDALDRAEDAYYASPTAENFSEMLAAEYALDTAEGELMVRQGELLNNPLLTALGWYRWSQGDTAGSELQEVIAGEQFFGTARVNW